MSDKSLVLVIEDDTDIRNLIRINLRAAGFSVLTAETGEEGLELALAREIVLVRLAVVEGHGHAGDGVHRDDRPRPVLLVVRPRALL